MLALLLFLGLVLATVVLGFVAALQGGARAVATTNARRRLRELNRPAGEQAPPNTLSSM